MEYLKKMMKAAVFTELTTYNATLGNWKVGIEGPAIGPHYDNDVYKIMSEISGVRTTVLSAGPDGVVGVNAVETMFNAAPSSIDKLQALQVRGRAGQTGTHLSILPRVGTSGASELRLWNGGPVTEWLIGQRSGTSHELSFSTLDFKHCNTKIYHKCYWRSKCYWRNYYSW